VQAVRVVIDPDDLSVSTPTDGPSNEFVLPAGFFKHLTQSITN